jgi:hypothetical protein
MVFVQFDSWYASEQLWLRTAQPLIKYVRRQGWHVTCALKCNRKLNGKRIDQLAYALRHKRYTQIAVTACERERHNLLRAPPVPAVLAQADHWPPGERSLRRPRLLLETASQTERSGVLHLCLRQGAGMSTALTRSAQQALQGFAVSAQPNGYSGRWSCEVLNFYIMVAQSATIKNQAGLAYFRVQSYEAVDRYMAVVLLAWAYVERRYKTERSAQIKTYGDIMVADCATIIRRHRDEHTVDWFTGALEMMRETNDVQQVLQQFLHPELQTA